MDLATRLRASRNGERCLGERGAVGGCGDLRCRWWCEIEDEWHAQRAAVARRVGGGNGNRVAAIGDAGEIEDTRLGEGSGPVRIVGSHRLAIEGQSDGLHPVGVTRF